MQDDCNANEAKVLSKEFSSLSVEFSEWSSLMNSYPACIVLYYLVQQSCSINFIYEEELLKMANLNQILFVILIFHYGASLISLSLFFKSFDIQKL